MSRHRAVGAGTSYLELRAENATAWMAIMEDVEAEQAVPLPCGSFCLSCGPRTDETPAQGR